MCKYLHDVESFIFRVVLAFVGAVETLIPVFVIALG